MNYIILGLFCYAAGFFTKSRRDYNRGYNEAMKDKFASGDSNAPAETATTVVTAKNKRFISFSPTILSWNMPIREGRACRVRRRLQHRPPRTRRWLHARSTRPYAHHRHRFGTPVPESSAPRSAASKTARQRR